MEKTPRVVGAKCPDCNDGTFVRNPKTEKVFCDKKCFAKGQNPVQKFEQGLNKEVMSDQIMRTALSKSFIEAGKEYNLDELQQWEAYIKN